jgi:membrane-bound serine protease (ClpP class)
MLLAMGTVAALVIIGAVLLVLETVLPGLVVGFLGVLCLASAVVLGYSEFGLAGGNVVLLIVLAGAVAGAVLYARKFPESRMARRFVLQRTIGTVGAERPELLDQTGVAHTTLRPSGTALIQGHRIDVVSEGAMIERGTPVRVVAVEGLRVVVRAAS